MQIAVLLTSIILLIIGFIGLMKSNTLIKNIISIETITLSSILNLVYYNNISSSVLLLLVVITVSELSIAILFIIHHKINIKWSTTNNLLVLSIILYLITQYQSNIAIYKFIILITLFVLKTSKTLYSNRYS